MATVCSIDIGVKHLAIIVVNVYTKEIKYWAIHEVRENNGSFSQSISSLMELALQFMTETVVVVIEKQIRCRGVAFLRHGMNNCLVEAGVEQFFINKMPLAHTVRFDSRHKLIRHGVNMANIVLKKSLKIQSIQICKQFLRLNIQNANINMFFDNYNDKKDDLSDCLLQALAYYNMHSLSFQRLIRVPEILPLEDNLMVDMIDDSILDLTDE